jgi:hypothetical protein
VFIRVGFYLRHKHHFASYHHIISHSIASYIILHQQKTVENKGKCSFENIRWSMKECVVAQSMPSADIFLHRRGIFISSITIQQLWKNIQYCNDRRGIFFFVKHQKKEMCFFAIGSKTVCTEVSCITKKYITSIYIQIVYKCFLQN